MINIRKNTLGLAAVAIFAVGGLTSAMTADEFKVILEDYRAEKVELKAKISNGEITFEDAEKIWQEKMTELREKREEYFDQRVKLIQDRVEQIRATNPELADTIESRVARMEENRVEMRAKMNEVRDNTVDPAERREKMREIRTEYQAEREAGIGINTKARNGSGVAGDNAGAGAGARNGSGVAGANAGAGAGKGAGAGAGAGKGAGAGAGAGAGKGARAGMGGSLAN